MNAKPTLIKAGDRKLLVGGYPIKVDCYIIAASNYDLMIHQVKTALMCNKVGKNLDCTVLLNQLLTERGESV